MITEHIDYDYETLLAMLNSEDEENVVLALTSLENIEVIPNIVKTLLLRKESKASISLWNKHAPTVVSILMENDVPFNSVITFKKIMELGKVFNAPKHHILLLIERVNVQVYHDMKALGYDYIKSINVRLDHAE